MPNRCHKCGVQIPRGHQVARTVGYCHNCGSLTDLKTRGPYRGAIEVKMTRECIERQRLTYLARVCGQVGFMPNP